MKWCYLGNLQLLSRAVSLFTVVVVAEMETSPQKDNLGIYDYWGMLYGGLSRGCYEAYLITLTDRFYLFCYSGQRGTIALKLVSIYLEGENCLKF